MEVKSWQQKAGDREKWASVMKTADGLRGSWSQEVSKLVQNFGPLSYYSASSRYFLPTFRVNLSVPSSVVLPLEDGTDRLTRNVGKKAPLLAA
jgi:hypothetical protein